MLGHLTNSNLTNIYKILQNGYLKSGKESGTTRMFGIHNKPSKYIYMMFAHTSKNNRVITYNFELDTSLLVEKKQKSYLNIGWLGKPSKNAICIDHKSNLQLDKLLDDFSSKLPDSAFSHEILLERQVNLKKYLRKITIYSESITRARHTYNKFITLLEKEYPDVVLVIHKK